jgi:ribokinase
VIELAAVGDSFEDFVFYGLTRLPGRGRELKTRSMVRSAGGGALITAVAAARLGTRCAIVSALSPDCERLLRSERVAVRNLRAAGEPSAVTVALSTRTDRRFVTFEGINENLPARIRRVLPRIRARHVHFAFVPRPCKRWLAVVARLQQRGVTTSWDFGWDDRLATDPELWALATSVDLMFVNRDETLLYARRRTLRDAIARWRAVPNHIVIKLGRVGARVVGGSIDVHVPSKEVGRVVDTTGAGDAFNGGFLASLLRGRSIRQALAVGNRLGALSLRQPGGIAGLPRASGRA